MSYEDLQQVTCFYISSKFTKFNGRGFIQSRRGGGGIEQKEGVGGRLWGFVFFVCLFVCFQNHVYTFILFACLQMSACTVLGWLTHKISKT